jgi:hypothetical protein
MNTKRTLSLGLALVTFLIAGPATSKPSGFSARVDNPWYPLKPGSVYVYRGVKDREPAREVMTVTQRTRLIDGAPCVVVRDLLYLSGRLEERTTDWYTEDAKGNVWYFGERTAELDKNGKVTNTTGSWTAGVHGARPGIFHVRAPDDRRARRGYCKGQAGDHFMVLQPARLPCVPYISTSHAMLTKGDPSSPA